MIVYLGSLRDRMERRGFDPYPGSIIRLMTAYKAPQGLNVTLHSLGCGMAPRKRRTASAGYIVAGRNPWASRVV
jgi:hypothetical protein